MSESEYDILLVELGPKVMDSWDAWNPAASSSGVIKVATRALLADVLDAHRRVYGTSGGGSSGIQSSYSLDLPNNYGNSIDRDNGVSDVSRSPYC